ncbi:MAG: TetR/AcrR family transcriptional regulator [Acidimicrobiales bacterium]
MPVTLAPPSHRERKKQATRDTIAVAALELTEERGIAGVTVDAIAARADVAPRTFFNYFSSKEDAVVGTDPHRSEDLATALLERPAADAPLDALRHVLTEDLMGRALSAEILRRRICVIKAQPELRAAMAGQQDALGRRLSEAMAARAGRSLEDPYPALVTGAALAAVRVALLHWCDDGGRTPLISWLDVTFAHLSAGLTGETAGRPRRRPLSPAPSRRGGVK